MKDKVIRLTNKAPFFAGTFHSFCVQILRIDGSHINIPKNFLIYDDQDAKDLVKQILLDKNLKSEIPKAPAIASQISQAKSQMLTPTQ